MNDFDIDKKNLKKQFENVFGEITKCFPKLLQTENFIEEIPKGKILLDIVSQIEAAYPKTWTVDYIRKKIS